jgi:hypothetical protein
MTMDVRRDGGRAGPSPARPEDPAPLEEPARHGQHLPGHSVPVDELSPVPSPGTPPGTMLPGVQAAGATHADDGHIRQITRLAHAAPGKPDGEADTRHVVPLWRQNYGDRVPPLPWEQ